MEEPEFGLEQALRFVKQVATSADCTAPVYWVDSDATLLPQNIDRAPPPMVAYGRGLDRVKMTALLLAHKAASAVGVGGIPFAIYQRGSRGSCCLSVQTEACGSGRTLTWMGSAGRSSSMNSSVQRLDTVGW